MERPRFRLTLVLSTALLAAGLIAAGIPAGAAWELETVDSDGNVGGDCSLALNDYGYPCVSYYDEDLGNLKYAWLQGPTWNILTVDSDTDVGRWTSLALDSIGRARISYVDSLHHDLKYIEQIGASWEIEVVDSTYVHDAATSLVLDSGEEPHISYCEIQSALPSLNYLSRQGTIWTLDHIEATGCGTHSSVAVNAEGYVRISYRSDASPGLRYVIGHGGHYWQTLDTEGDTGYFTSLKLDSVENPHIAYYTASGPDGAHLSYQHYDGAAWTQENVDLVGGPGKYASLDLDSQGRPHIAYAADFDREVRYAYRDASGWHIEVVHSGGGVAAVSLDLDHNDAAHICYHDSDAGDLVYAHWYPDPTPTPDDVYYRLDLELPILQGYDYFHLGRICGNPEATALDVDELVILDIFGYYFFWPGWTDALDWDSWTLAPGVHYDETVLQFMWPEGAGSASGLKFWGAFLDGATQDLILYDVIDWGFIDHPAPFFMVSSAFAEGETIPDHHTCEGEDVSPEIFWSPPPTGTQSLALICDDPDAPGGDWVHWVIYDIDTYTYHLEAAIPTDGTLPEGWLQGQNDWGQTGWRGPCPPGGQNHRYFFKLYALDANLNLPPGVTKASLLAAMEGHILGQTQIMGMFAR